MRLVLFVTAVVFILLLSRILVQPNPSYWEAGFLGVMALWSLLSAALYK
jgi:hypothetical protein